MILDRFEKNGADHAADAFAHLYMFLEVREGRINNIPTYKKSGDFVSVVTGRQKRNSMLRNKGSLLDAMTHSNLGR